MSTAAPGRIDEPAAPPRRRVAAWALWDWGSAAFNAVVTSFVFSTYLASGLFVDPAIVGRGGDDARNPALVAAKAENATVISTALTIAGLLIALLAPVLGQRSDGSGRRRLWLAINTGIVVLAMLAMVFVGPCPPTSGFGAALLAAGNLFFEFASVNYNAMLVQVITPRTIGRVSGLGWGLGYVGGIVLLVLLLVAVPLQTSGRTARRPARPAHGGRGRRAGRPPRDRPGRHLVRRLRGPRAAGACPRCPPRRTGARAGHRRVVPPPVPTIASSGAPTARCSCSCSRAPSSATGSRRCSPSGRSSRPRSSASRPPRCFCSGSRANLVAGIGTFAAGWFDDRLGAKPVILGRSPASSSADPRCSPSATPRPGSGLRACSCASSSGRAVVEPALPRADHPRRPRGRDLRALRDDGPRGELPRAGPLQIVVGVTGDTRFGIVGIAIVLLAGLLLMLRVRGADARAA